MLQPEMLSFQNIMFQAAFGYVVNPVLWFLPALWYITLVVYLIYRHVRDTSARYWILGIITCACYIFQYMYADSSSLRELPRAMANPIGRIPELLPFAVLGLLTSDFYPIIEKSRVKNIFITRYSGFTVSAMGIWLSHVYLWPGQPSGFGYQGAGVLITAVSLFIPFFIAERIRISGIQKIIQIFAPVTLGIFCVHLLLKDFFYYLFKFFKVMWIVEYHMMLFVILIFLVSAFFCLACMRILPRQLKVLFS